MRREDAAENGKRLLEYRRQKKRPTAVSSWRLLYLRRRPQCNRSLQHYRSLRQYRRKHRTGCIPNASTWTDWQRAFWKAVALCRVHIHTHPHMKCSLSLSFHVHIFDGQVRRIVLYYIMTQYVPFVQAETRRYNCMDVPRFPISYLSCSAST